MRFRSFVRRTALVFACAAALAAAPQGPCGARHDRPRTQTVTTTAEFRGGWVARHLNACALAFGLMYGGLAGVPINPMGGATAFAIGFGISVFACP